MYQHSYAEVLEDDQSEARRTESAALDRAVTLLMQADRAGHPSREGVDALYFTCRLWTVFIDELASPDNALPNELRANLISIGIWIVKESDAIRHGTSTNYAGIADICAIIRDGLH
jgi:flagellar protein FlaF